MTAQFPDVGAIRTALSMATRAPSVHNTQPWRWQVDDASVHLYADTSRQLPQTDPDRRDLVISCGATLHHAIVAFSALGWQCKVARLPDPTDPSHLAVIRLSPHDPGDVDIALAAAIPTRRTDRRFFSSWPVPRVDIAMMGIRVARMGVHLRRVEVSIDIGAIIAQAVRRHLHDDAYLRELTTWSGRHAATAGVPARNAPVSDPGARLPSRIFAGGVLAQADHATASQDHSVLLALGTAEDDDMSRLRAGEATSMALLTSASLGLASCPVTEPLEIPETREALRSEVFGDVDHPQMMLRVGWAPVGADPLPATPRRPFDDVISTAEGLPLS